MRKLFHAEHAKRYSQSAPDESMEIVSLRLVVTAARQDNLAERWLSEPWQAEGAVEESTRDVVFDDPERPLKTRILWRPCLPAGTTIAGPAIIEEPNATTLVHPGDVASVTAAGHLIIAIGQEVHCVTKAHPITVEVVRNAVVAYADEMANVLAKSAYNMMIYEVRDYCCGLLDVKGRMISQNRGGLPIFLADLGPAVEDGIQKYGLDGFKPGDIVVMNHGGRVRPASEQCRDLRTLLSRRASWWGLRPIAPIGWISAACGRASARARPRRSTAKVCSCARSRFTRPESAMRRCGRSCATTSAIPTRASAILRAQIAACQVGAQRYAELLARYGRETVEDLRRGRLGSGRSGGPPRGRNHSRRRI